MRILFFDKMAPCTKVRQSASFVLGARSYTPADRKRSFHVLSFIVLGDPTVTKYIP